MKKAKNKGSTPVGKPEKSWSEEGIPSDRVTPGAPNPPPALGELINGDPMKNKDKKPKMRHGAY